MREIRECLSGFRFKELFTEHLLWNSSKGSYAIEAGESVYELQAIADKKGLVALICQPTPGAQFPGSAERKRIEREVAKLHHEHLIVFTDREHTRQVWQVPKRESGKTTGFSEVPYFVGKGVEHLARRIEAISFTLDESETVSLIEVSARVNQALLAEKVTKKFFKEFSDQRKAFVKFLDWIEDESKRDWYCSVLLNRLMFIYFLGGKGFLPGGTGFLTKNLAANIQTNGADTFYTHFLLPLSFFGLGERQGSRRRFEQTFKDVLYLDGGLFTVHQVERELGLNKEAVERGTFPEEATIPDSEFKKWFDYFDKWRWTLDEDKVENEGYISPHILGYIFEKYINQKQMGAYYTKEDITGYICRNTIIPRLFDMLAETGDKGKKAVRPLPVGPHPNLLNDGRGISDGEGIDRYIYPSVKQESKLPTETDYELDQRRRRYEGILSDFDAGKIEGIDDFVTYNLDIEKLAVDFVGSIQDPGVLHAFYFRGLQQITVLDPTCGSGAFLFEALTILYPLYNACLSRMRYLVSKATGAEPDIVNWGDRLHFDDLDVDQSTLANFVDSGGSQAVAELRAEVERINDHPSAEYFIKKSIIVNNLFGVDIMEEAVEICKLRLFLTLIATVERNDSKDNFGVEPLPDIDFNILAGNTLVGYTSIDDIDRLWHEVELGSSTLAFAKDHTRLKRLVEEYEHVLKAWRLQQLGEWRGAYISKEQVLNAVESVRPELNKDIWHLYKDASLATVIGKGKSRELTQLEFNRSHEPFHWLLEFPGMAAKRGFDCVVGNPPYVETTGIYKQYRILGFRTVDTKDLYAPVFERSVQLLSENSRLGLIVRMSSLASTRMMPLRTLLTEEKRRGWVSSYSASDQPASLFTGVRDRLSVWLLGRKEEEPRCTTTSFLKWFNEERPMLFDTKIEYGSGIQAGSEPWPRLGNQVAECILEKIRRRASLGAALTSSGTHVLYYHESPVHWHKAWLSIPYYWHEERGVIESVSLRSLNFEHAWQLQFMHCFANSSLFYWYFNSLSDCRHLTRSFFEEVPIGLLDVSEPLKRQCEQLSARLSASYEANKSRYRRVSQKTGLSEFDAYYPKHSKDILDEVDAMLAQHFGFTVEELNFIQRYDLKYRMGLGDDEDEG